MAGGGIGHGTILFDFVTTVLSTKPPLLILHGDIKTDEYFFFVGFLLSALGASCIEGRIEL